MSKAWEMGLLNYLNLLMLIFCSLYLKNNSFFVSLAKLMQLEALNCLQTRGGFGWEVIDLMAALDYKTQHQTNTSADRFSPTTPSGVNSFFQ